MVREQISQSGVFRTVGNVAHRVSWPLLSAWKNTVTIRARLSKRPHRQILEGSRRSVDICLSRAWGVPA
eukprot:8178311-Pyramimonas_sp.AAC.1